MSYEILIPILPERELSPNGRNHWSKVNAAKGRLKDFVVGFIASEVTDAELSWWPIDPAVLHIEYRLCRKGLRPDPFYRPSDVDNALSACKAAIDGLVTAGVLVDDKRKNVRLGDVELIEVAEPDAEGIWFKVETP